MFAMPTMGHEQNILMWDSFIRDSFVEATLLSVTGPVDTGLIAHWQ